MANDITYNELIVTDYGVRFLDISYFSLLHNMS